MRTIKTLLLAVTFASLVTRPAGATFHLMQIEQVIGGVNGHTDIQAVQLRMRTVGQDLVSNGRLLVRDASGANPVLLIDFTSNVVNGAAGDRVLAATANFSTITTPAVTPDFILTNPIPASYMAAGSLTWEDDFGTVLWRLSWGGASYTGSGTGALTNDADGIFNPPFGGPLPSDSQQALLFKFAANAPSTNNANDYALTAGAATFTNNGRISGSINNIVGVGEGIGGGGLMLSPPTPNPVTDRMAYSLVLPRAGRTRVRLVDVHGRVVRRLLDESLSAGPHSFRWDRSGDGPALASGVYVLVVTADGVTRTQRFALIK